MYVSQAYCNISGNAETVCQMFLTKMAKSCKTCPVPLFPSLVNLTPEALIDESLLLPLD
jgi:hypothetical protein